MSYFVHRDRVFMVREKVELGLGKMEWKNNKQTNEGKAEKRKK